MIYLAIWIKPEIISNLENPTISLYFPKNLKPTYFPDCEIELAFTSLDETPLITPQVSIKLY